MTSMLNTRKCDITPGRTLMLWTHSPLNSGRISLRIYSPEANLFVILKSQQILKGFKGVKSTILLSVNKIGATTKNAHSEQNLRKKETPFNSWKWLIEEERRGGGKYYRRKWWSVAVLPWLLNSNDVYRLAFLNRSPPYSVHQHNDHFTTSEPHFYLSCLGYFGGCLRVFKELCSFKQYTWACCTASTSGGCR